MRIRKHASRLLPGAQPIAPPPPPPPPPPAGTPPHVPDACKLNCSPWDLDATPKKEEGEKDKCITGNCNKGIIKEEEEAVAVNATTNTEIAAEIKNDGQEAGEKTRQCNKKGKGWCCSKPAEPQHSFCSYHLGKHRAYLSARSSGRKRTSESGSDSYYYYDGFGPGSVKRRGTDVKAKAEDKEEGDIICDLLMDQSNDDDDDAKGGEGVKKCSKRGKGWNCTRPAKLPHPFCDYHLTILRSYVSGRKPGQTKKNIAAASDRSDYGGFEPWQGKRRGGGDVKVIVDCDDGNKEDCNLEEIEYCRKTDGRGWYCKRPAHLPHSYCSHHLSQIRAYNHGSTETGSHAKKREPRKKAADSQSNFYYYYGGFGPWRGKTRGQAAEQVEAPAEEIGRVARDDYEEGEEGSRESVNGKDL